MIREPNISENTQTKPINDENNFFQKLKKKLVNSGRQILTQYQKIHKLKSKPSLMMMLSQQRHHFQIKRFLKKLLMRKERMKCLTKN